MKAILRLPLIGADQRIANATRGVLESVLILQEKLPCQGTCQVDLLQRNPFAARVCPVCRLHWMLLAAIESAAAAVK